MRIPTAELTNAITDIAMGLFYLISLFVILYKRKNVDCIKWQPISYVALLTVASFTGAIAHIPNLPPTTEALARSMISLQMVGIGLILLNSHKIPSWLRWPGIILTAALPILYAISYWNHALYLTDPPKFIYIAIPTAYSITALAFYSKRLIRWGALGVLFANIFQIIGTVFVANYFGKLVYDEYKYHNDIYHFLLILSGYLICKGILRGEWIYNDKRKQPK